METGRILQATGSAIKVWLVVILPVLLPVACFFVRHYFRTRRSPLSEDDRLYTIIPRQRTATQNPDLTISANLGVAERAAQRLTSRVVSVSMLSGSVSFLLMVMPLISNLFVAREDYLVWAANGGSYFVAFGLAQAPWGLALSALALRAIDARAVWCSLVCLIACMCVVCIYLIRQAFIVVHPTISIGNAIFLAAYVIGIAILILSSWCASCCSSSIDQFRWQRWLKRSVSLPPIFQVSKRQILQRFWAVLRLCSIVFGLFALLLFSTPDFNGGVLDSNYGNNERSIRTGSYLLVALSYIISGLVMRQSLRAAVVRFLGRRVKYGGSKEVEAAFVSSLIHQRKNFTAVAAYKKGCELFKAYPAADVCEDLLTPLDELGHNKNLVRERLVEKTCPAKLGEVEAFLSYTTLDNTKAQTAQLLLWASQQPPGTTIWVDQVCLPDRHIDISLACLPIFVSGCRKLLVIAGPAYPTRLWCAMELFVWLRMGGHKEDILVRLAVCPGESESKFEDNLMRFDALKANCFMAEDRHQMLAAIEATFGTTTHFNRIIRDILTAQLAGRAALAAA